MKTDEAPTKFNEQTGYLIKMNELVKRLCISRSMIYQWLNKSSPYHNADFPRPIRIGKRLIAWRATEVTEFINNRQQA